jgi:hypothetical protein
MKHSPVARRLRGRTDRPEAPGRDCEINAFLLGYNARIVRAKCNLLSNSRLFFETCIRGSLQGNG